MLGKIRSSLTARIFLATSLILLAASAVTYGVIALATPITYTSIVTSELETQADTLVDDLFQSSFEESGALIDRFISDTGAGVLITGEDGRTVQTPAHLSIGIAYEDEDMIVAVSPSEESENALDYQITPSGTALFGSASGGTITSTVDGIYESVTVSSDSPLSAETVINSIADSSNVLHYGFCFTDRDEGYLLYITPPVERANQTVQALGRVAPLLLIAMLLFSALCALFYSRWITRPIVRLSAISQRMAGLDFDWRCSESRADEIGALGHSLNELSDRLSAALTDLQTANAALQRDIDRERELERQRLAFFAAASHELKTPVTILKGQLSGMLDGIDVYQDRDTYLARALQVTGRMEGLVQEILTVSRMESQDFALHPQPVALDELAGRQLALYAELIEQKGLRLETALSPAPVTADPALLGKALDNLLSNAAFYAPEGARVAVTTGTEDGAAVLTVENTGSHIPEEALPHIFEAFYRAEASRNRRTGGSGLGLYIVRMILDRHGAACQAENTAGGVRFTVRFLPEFRGNEAAPSPERSQ